MDTQIFFYLLSNLSILSTYLFDMISNNQNYLKNILRKTRTKKLQNFSGAPEFQEEGEKFSFGP